MQGIKELLMLEQRRVSLPLLRNSKFSLKVSVPNGTSVDDRVKTKQTISMLL